MKVGVLNVGSATVRGACVELRGGALRGARRFLRPADVGEDPAAIHEILDRLEEECRVDAIGHRIVHGGTRYTAPARIDDGLLRALDRVAPLARALNRRSLLGVRAAQRRFPELPHVAAFDTAFHAGRPLESIRYALPPTLTDSLALYRYGFQGLAHEALARAVAETEGAALEEVSAVTLHLGVSASACAVRDGRSIETSMGFGPLGGLVMATRSGNIEPAAILHLCGQGRPVSWVEEQLTTRSGLLGLGGSSSVPELLRREAAGEERARLALAVFVRSVVLTAGAYLTLLDGEGALAFGGGIGFGSPEIRARVAEGLAAWGVALDAERNEAGAGGRISRPRSRPVYAFETDEEAVIAHGVAKLLSAGMAMNAS